MTAPLENHLQRLAQSIKALLQTDVARQRPRRRARARRHSGRRRTPATTARTAKPMFAEIMNFSYQRTTKQAIGWYLMYLAIGIVAGFAIGRMASMASTTIEDAARIGCWPGSYRRSRIISRSPSCCFGIARRMRRASCSFSQAIVLSVLVGGLGGLIPLAMLSRRPVMDARSHPLHTRRLCAGD